MSNKTDYKVVAYCRIAYEPKTALYCRTAVQDSFAIEHQKDRLLQFAKENGYTNIAWYIDDGEKGNTLNRPAMRQLIADIKLGKVKTVIVTGIDRIARGILPFAEWQRLFQESNAKCITLGTGGQDLFGEVAYSVCFLSDLIGDKLG